ncbi:hypothetical protein IQE94_15965 [Synechocystis sp. PCC 7339]|uniref:hypothetical protein n=1 Tax=unclassified Synechocystis TaxID=2640012 RepID=UPI001BAF0E3A|nr:MULTISPECIES: hypothetical protein [unclassified Synechocystis]QUS60019.1 hypothetical protein HTZ78_04585 [Synechocystis sp. PCC 7338]UAJ72531.1 hypothetical protein IQE94_15965 [Synechocystis sp. PCC 7339]
MSLFPIFTALLSISSTTIDQIPVIVEPQPFFVSQANAADILVKLPRPQGSPNNVGSMFMANAYGQQGLNFQANGKPAPTVKFYQDALTKLGYEERTINATQGDWGFSIVFDTPAELTLTPKDAGKSVVLVIQGTMLGPDTINLNLRFEEI